MLKWNSSIGPSLSWIGCIGDKLYAHAILVFKSEDGLPKASQAIRYRDSKSFESVFPKIKASDRDGEGCVGQLANTLFTSACPYKWESGKNCSGTSERITEIEVIHIRSIKIDGLLYQTKSQYARIKI